MNNKLYSLINYIHHLPNQTLYYHLFQEALYEQIKWAPFGVDWKEDDYDEDDWDFSGGCRYRYR